MWNLSQVFSTRQTLWHMEGVALHLFAKSWIFVGATITSFPKVSYSYASKYVVYIYKGKEDNGKSPFAIKKEATRFWWGSDGNMLSIEGTNAIWKLPFLLEASLYISPGVLCWLWEKLVHHALLNCPACLLNADWDCLHSKAITVGHGVNGFPWCHIPTKWKEKSPNIFICIVPYTIYILKQIYSKICFSVNSYTKKDCVVSR